MNKFRWSFIAALSFAGMISFSACSDDSSGLPKENPVSPDDPGALSSEGLLPVSSEGALDLSSSSAGTVLSSTGTENIVSSGSTQSSAALTPRSAASVRTTLPTEKPTMASDPKKPMDLYDIWKGFHVTTLTEEAAKYPTLGKDFKYIFGDYINQGLPVARVIWSNYTYAGCQIDEANGSNMFKRGCTVSEGIGYGMLITVFREDWDAFDGIWNYSRGYRNSKYASGNGLMPWLTSSFSYDIGDQASATDADLDIATSLIIAYYKTQNKEYLNDAIKLATAIWDNEINPSNLLIYSGDTPMWKNPSKGEPVYNLSYFSPVALRLFAAVDAAHDWKSVLDAMYTYMSKVQDTGTGVFPDWSNAAGVAANPNNNSADKTYWTFNKESVRIPWRIAWDYYWYQDARAAAILNTLQNFIATKSNSDPAAIPAVNYSWNASAGADVTSPSLSTQWLGAWCLTGMAGASTWLDGCLQIFNAAEMKTNAASYFPNILQMMFSQLMNGTYQRPF